MSGQTILETLIEPNIQNQAQAVVFKKKIILQVILFQSAHQNLQIVSFMSLIIKRITFKMSHIMGLALMMYFMLNLIIILIIKS